jgi:hypothetical protein
MPGTSNPAASALPSQLPLECVMRAGPVDIQSNYTTTWVGFTAGAW